MMPEPLLPRDPIGQESDPFGQVIVRPVIIV